jgi:hypothetical protein
MRGTMLRLSVHFVILADPVHGSAAFGIESGLVLEPA